MRQIWFIARSEIAHQFRSRETIVWIFVMPIIFFYFIGTVTGGFSGASMGRPDPLVLVAPANAGFLADELARRLESQRFAVTRALPDQPRGDDPPGRQLVVPALSDGRSFTDALLAGEAQTLRVESTADGNAANFERIRIQRAVYGLLADLAVAAIDTAAAPNQASLGAVAAAPRTVTLEVTTAGKRRTIPSGFEQTIPGTMVMFTMLILLTGGAIQLVLERERGLLRRLASAPIERSHLVAGKWIGKLLLGLVQLAFALAAGTLLFDMSWGDALPMVIVLLVAWAAFNASLALLARQHRAQSGANGRHGRADDDGPRGARRLLVADRDHAGLGPDVRAGTADRMDDGCDAPADQLRRPRVVDAAACGRAVLRRRRARARGRADLPVSVIPAHTGFTMKPMKFMKVAAWAGANLREVLLHALHVLHGEASAFDKGLTWSYHKSGFTD